MLLRNNSFIGNWPLGESLVRVEESAENKRTSFVDLTKPRYYQIMRYGPGHGLDILFGYRFIPIPDRNNNFANNDPEHQSFYFIDKEGYLRLMTGKDVTNAVRSPEFLTKYNRGLEWTKAGRDIEMEKEDAKDRGLPAYFSSQQTMSMKSKNPSSGDENEQNTLDDQTESAAKISLKSTKPNLSHVKTGFVLKKDNLLSKSFLIQHTYSFLEKYIFNHAILKTDVYKTVPTVLETISEKAGISVQAHEELSNVDVHMMSHKSVFLQVYVVGHEKTTQASDDKGFFSKLKGAFSSSSSGTQITENKDYGLKKSELISASLLEGVPLIGPKSVTPTSAYSRILQFYEGKSLVFQSKFPSQDLAQSNNEPFLVFYLNQRVYETADGGYTAVRSMRDTTTGRQINLEDIDGYWLLCFGKTRLLYIIKANIAPREEYTGRETSLANLPPSDAPPPRPHQATSTLKKPGFNKVSQTSSSGSAKRSSFFVQSSDFLENTDSKGKNKYEDEASHYDHFNKRVVDLYRVSNTIVEKHDKHFSVISKEFFRKIMSRIGTFYLSSDYALKAETSALQIPDISVYQLIGFLFPEEDPAQVFEAVKGENSDLEDKHNIIREYFTNTSDGNSEQLAAALIETHVIQMDYGVLLKMIDFLTQVSPSFHTLSILGVFTTLRHGTKQHSHEVLSKITNSTFYKKYFLDSLAKEENSPQFGIDESELMTYFSSEEQFMRFTNYSTFLLLFDMFVEITKKMGNGVKTFLLVMSNFPSGIVQFVKQSVLKTLFCFPEFYLQDMSQVEQPDSRSSDLDKTGFGILKEHIVNQRNTTLKYLSDVTKFELLNRPQIGTNEALSVESCLDILAFTSFSSKRVLVSLDQSKQLSFQVFKAEIIEISLQAENAENEMDSNGNRLSSTGSKPIASLEEIIEDNVLTSSAQTISQKWSFVLADAMEDKSFVKSEMARKEEYEKHRITGRSLLSKTENEQYSNPPMIYDEILEILGNGEDTISKKDKALLEEQLVKIRQLASLRLVIITCLRSLVLTGRFVGNEKYICHNVIKCFNESIPYLNEVMTNTCAVNAIAQQLILDSSTTFENFDEMQQRFMNKTQEYVLNITGDIAANLFL